MSSAVTLMSAAVNQDCVSGVSVYQPGGDLQQGCIQYSMFPCNIYSTQTQKPDQNTFLLPTN